MAYKAYDRVKQKCVVTGPVASISLDAAILGFRQFSEVLSHGDTIHYMVINITNGEWEAGLGTYNSTDQTLSRSAVSSSNSNAAVSFSSGEKEVFITALSENVPMRDPSTGRLQVGNVVSNIATDGSGAVTLSGTVTMPGTIRDSAGSSGTEGQYLSLNSSGNLVWLTRPETITYLANSISMPDPTKGTYNSGNVASIQTFGDYNLGNYYSINDTATQPGFIVDIGFTGVVQFNRVVMSLAYQVTSGHTVYVELYNYATSAWEIIQQYTGLTNWVQFTIGVISSAPFISGGAVSLRIWHESFGNPAHETKLDYVALEDATQGGMGPKGDRGATGATGPVGPSFRTISVSGQSDLVAATNDTLNVVAGSGISLTTHSTSPKSLTISSSVPLIKTFNVLGSFTGPLTGTARFTPVQSDTIVSVVLNAALPIANSSLSVVLYRNGIEMVGAYEIPAGQYRSTYSGLNIPIIIGDYYTVNVISGSAKDFTMSLYNITVS